MTVRLMAVLAALTLMSACGLTQAYRDRVAAMQRECGRDYNTVRIGMSADRLRECSLNTYTPSSVLYIGEDVIAEYDIGGALVTMENGVVTSIYEY